MPLPQNTLLQGGKYKIVRFISAGGFGCTYEAISVATRKTVAIKELYVKDISERNEQTLTINAYSRNKSALLTKIKRKFLEEANALRQMNHTNIVRVYDSFEENGTAYYVMDYINGKSIHDILKSHGCMPENQAIEYIRQVAQALKYVHAQNRLHLDIKPSNIMVDNYNNAVLINFGAKQYDEESGEDIPIILKEIPWYAPIEQFGNSVQTFTPATDIYSLGATLYKMLTGITPPGANMMAGYDEALKPLPSFVSLKTCKAVEKAMMIKRKDRPQTIDDFLSLLDSSDLERERVATPHPINKDDEATLVDSGKQR